jgi:hypothetical protein
MIAERITSVGPSALQRLSGERLLLLRINSGPDVARLVNEELDRRAIGLRPHHRTVPRRLNRRPRFAA